MTAYYYLIQLIDSERVIYRSTYFSSLRDARLFARRLGNVIEIGRRNSQGVLFYKP